MGNSSSQGDLKGWVFDIQHFSLDDGPGIRTTVFMKGCPLRCRWCQNPESLSAEREIAFRAERCMDCCACLDVCPLDAIIPGDAYRIDRSRCNDCGTCVEVCPTKALFIIGRSYSIADLVSDVQRDAAFYEESGGGVTISGGEPTLQFDFLLAFLRACKEAGLHTAIETNGFTTQKKLAVLLPFLDHIYFELKVIARDEHLMLTGASNVRILDNARWLAESGALVIFRVPMVAGMTATEKNISALGAFLNELGVTGIEICPYQNNWVGKLSWLQRTRDPVELLPPLSEKETLAVVKAFSQQGIVARSEAVVISD